jgi:hypothetical protein
VCRYATVPMKGGDGADTLVAPHSRVVHAGAQPAPGQGNNNVSGQRSRAQFASTVMMKSPAAVGLYKLKKILLKSVETHSLKAPGFNTCTLHVTCWFQSWLFTFYLYRYAAGTKNVLETSKYGDDFTAGNYAVPTKGKLPVRNTSSVPMQQKAGKNFHKVGGL